MILFDAITADTTSESYNSHGAGSWNEVHLSGGFGGGTVTAEVSHNDVKADGTTAVQTDFVEVDDSARTAPSVYKIYLAADVRMRLVLSGATGSTLTASVKVAKEAR